MGSKGVGISGGKKGIVVLDFVELFFAGECLDERQVKWLGNNMGVF